MRRTFAIIAGVALLLVGCTAPPAATPTTTSTGSPVPLDKACVYNNTGNAARPVSPPPVADVPTSGTVAFTMTMTAGVVNMTFDRAKAPCAVYSFESLVAQGYFDNINCHRLVPGFVLQCGAPTGGANDGPGYRFDDELTGHETYPRGTVAMANSGPNTNGSQFFIVLADANLPPSYDLLGTVSPESMSVIDAIAAKGVDPNDPAGILPAWGNHIDTITVG